MPKTGKERKMKSFAFNRPYCSPEGGLVCAVDFADAIDLVHSAYGYASNTRVYDAQTKQWYNERGIDKD